MKRILAFIGIVALFSIIVGAIYVISLPALKEVVKSASNHNFSTKDAQQLWLNAEAAETPEAQLKQWEALYKKNPLVLHHLPKVSEKALFYRYLHALLNHATQLNKPRSLEQALLETDAAQNLDENEVWWAKLDVARSWASLTPLNSIKHLSLLQQTAYHKDPLERSARLHGLGMSWLMQDKDSHYLLGADAATSAELILPDITTYRHYNLLRHAILNAYGQTDDITEKQYQKMATSAYQDGNYSRAISYIRRANNRPEGDLLLTRWSQQAAREKKWWLAEMFTFPIETGHMRSAAFGTLAKHYSKNGNAEKRDRAIKEAYFSAVGSRYSDKREKAMLRFAEDAAQAGDTKQYEKAIEWLNAHEITPTEFKVVQFEAEKNSPHPGAQSLSKEDVLSRLIADTLPDKKWAIALLKQFNKIQSEETENITTHAAEVSSAPIVYESSSNAVKIDNVSSISANDFSFSRNKAHKEPATKLYSEPQIASLPIHLSQWVPKTISHYLTQNSDTLKQPHILMLMRGTVSLRQLTQWLKDHHKATLIEHDGSMTRINAPLLIAPNASLEITGNHDDSLSLSAEDNTFIINAGTLNIKNTSIQSHGSHPKLQPFILSWDNGTLHLENNTVLNLGFDLPYARGITILGKNKKGDAKNTGYTSISRNTLSRLYTPISTYNVSNANVSLNIITEAANNGIEISESEDVTVMNNLILRNSNDGIRFNKSKKIRIKSNILAQNNRGIAIQESICVALSGNVLHRQKSSAAKLAASHAIALFYNEITENSKAAIEVAQMNNSQNQSSLLLSHNHISSNGIGLKSDKLGALYLENNNWHGQSPRLTEGIWWKRQPTLRRYLSTKSALYMHSSNFRENLKNLATSCK